MANPLVLENVWLQQQKFEDAHTLYQQLKAGTAGGAAQVRFIKENSVIRMY